MLDLDFQLESIFSYNFGHIIKLSENMYTWGVCKYDQSGLQMLNLARILEPRLQHYGVSASLVGG